MNPYSRRLANISNPCPCCPSPGPQGPQGPQGIAGYNGVNGPQRTTVVMEGSDLQVGSVGAEKI